MREAVSRDKPKKRAFAFQPYTPLTESQQISPNRAKNSFCLLNKVKNGLKRPYNIPKKAKNVWKRQKKDTS